MHLTSLQLAVRAFVKNYYIEGHRFYHTMDHIEVMLDGYEKYFHESFSEAEFLAIVYHDIVYLPWASGNEENSASMLNAHHKLYFSKVKQEVIDEAMDIILATKHDGPGKMYMKSAQRVVDLDLMVLGKSEDAYKKYVANTRREYAMFSDDQWNAGRAKVLQHFLDLPRIYYTDVMYERFEQQARDNIKQELEELKCLLNSSNSDKTS